MHVPAVWSYTLGSVVIVSLMSLVGVLAVAVDEQRLRHTTFGLVSLAAGAIFGDVFIHLLPDAFDTSGTSASLSIVAGIFSFFILEKFVRWRHEHRSSVRGDIQPFGYLNLIADGLHNLIDGALIGAAYLAGLPAGIATTIAIVMHEIPQEIGDFGVLISAGFGRRSALTFNLFSASLAVVGALITLALGAGAISLIPHMAAFAAGALLYLAGTDLLPELNRDSDLRRSALQLFAMGLGVGLMVLLTRLG